MRCGSNRESDGNITKEHNNINCLETFAYKFSAKYKI